MKLGCVALTLASTTAVAEERSTFLTAGGSIGVGTTTAETTLMLRGAVAAAAVHVGMKL